MYSVGHLLGAERTQLFKGHGIRALDIPAAGEHQSGIERRLQRRALHPRAPTGLNDGARKQVPGERRRHEHGYHARPRRLAVNCHLRRIASKGCDVSTHPAQGLDDVQRTIIHQQTVVAILTAEFGKAEKPESPHAIVETDKHDSVASKRLAGIHGRRGAAVDFATPVNPDKDGKPGPRLRSCRSPHVGHEAILGWDRPQGRCVAGERLLHAIVSVVFGGANFSPKRGGLWRPPAQSAGWRRRVRDSQEALRD